MVGLKDHQQQQMEGMLQFHSCLILMECMLKCLKVYNLNLSMQGTYYTYMYTHTRIHIYTYNKNIYMGISSYMYITHIYLNIPIHIGREIFLRAQVADIRSPSICFTSSLPSLFSFLLFPYPKALFMYFEHSVFPSLLGPGFILAECLVVRTMESSCLISSRRVTIWNLKL